MHVGDILEVKERSRSRVLRTAEEGEEVVCAGFMDLMGVSGKTSLYGYVARVSAKGRIVISAHVIKTVVSRSAFDTAGKLLLYVVRYNL